MKKFCFCFLSLFVLITLGGCKREPITLYVLETTDLHGNFDDAMSKTAHYIREMEQQYGDNLLLLDCGDCLQGTPYIFYYNNIDTLSEHIFTHFFNYLPYTAIEMGNHDIEVGLAVNKRVFSQVNAPVLCSNIVNDGKPIGKPYTIVKRNGYKIAILGLVNTASLEWIPEESREGCTFVPMLEAANRWVKVIERREHPDVVIGLFHAGADVNPANSVLTLAREVPGLDLICCGHVHKSGDTTLTNNYGKKVYLMEAGSSASHIAQATIHLTPTRRFKKPTIDISTRVFPTDTLDTDEAFDKEMMPFIEKSNEYIRKRISAIDTTIYSRDAVYGPSAWMELLQSTYKAIVSQKSVEVDFVVASPSSRDAVLYKGPLSLVDFMTLYPYENTLSVLEMTGQEIKDYLEYSHSLPIDNPDGPIYNFDTMSGIFYTVDLKKPYGQRITIEQTIRGEKWWQRKRYLVAMTTFRALGGGGHLSKGLGWSEEKMRKRCVAVSSENVRAALIAHYQDDSISISTVNNLWRYIE